MKKYSHLVMGGTFDHFHIGHQHLLSQADTLAEEITIGLTTNSFVSYKVFSNLIEPYYIRETSVKDYFTSCGRTKVTIIELTDIYGSAATDTTVDSIIATEETLPNVEKINEKRKEQGIHELAVELVTYKRDENGTVIKSERIRKGEINRKGFIYLNLFPSHARLLLPEELRTYLQEPLGVLIEGNNITQLVVNHIKKNNPTMVISVGDIITKALHDVGCVPDISIIDLKSQRKEIQKNESKVINEAGTIHSDSAHLLIDMIQKYVQEKRKNTLTIRGEEDLLALPSILLAPLNSVVLYGQRDKGVVMVTVTEQVKEYIVSLVKQFNLDAIVSTVTSGVV